MLKIGDILKNTSPPKKKKPNSERSLLIQDIADLTGMQFMVVFGKVRFLKGKEGTHKLKELFTKALQYSDDVKWKKIKFWMLLKDYKAEINNKK